MSDDLARQLRRDEGVVEHAYIDSEGWTTIGVGRLIDKRKGGRLRDDEIEFLLQNDITEKTEELMRRAPWVADLDGARQGVLINMAFNLGVSGLLISTDTGPAYVTAPEWHAIVAHGATVQQPIWQASFVLQEMEPVPGNYADDKWWTPSSL